MSGGVWFQVLGPQAEKVRLLNWVRVLMSKSCIGCRRTGSVVYQDVCIVLD